MSWIETNWNKHMDKATLIERWEQTLRVLENLPEHERQAHFDMGTWARETKCGTVACIAGHCAMDPWFMERGMRLGRQINGERLLIDGCDTFWGDDAGVIFITADINSVSDAIVAVRKHLEINSLHNEYVPPDEYLIDDAIHLARNKR